MVSAPAPLLAVFLLLSPLPAGIARNPAPSSSPSGPTTPPKGLTRMQATGTFEVTLTAQTDPAPGSSNQVRSSPAVRIIEQFHGDLDGTCLRVQML